MTSRSSKKRKLENDDIPPQDDELDNHIREDGDNDIENSDLEDDGKRAAGEGVKLTLKQKKYLLPHFTMILVGKPGSGKSTLIKRMVESTKFYKEKFDRIFIVSPSGEKLGIDVDPS